MIKIHPDVIANLLEYAKVKHPNESMILLGGSISKDGIVVDHLIYQHVQSNRRSAISYIDTSALSGVVGSCHSHPGRSNIPSIADKKFFSKYLGIHLIIKYPYGKEDVAFYDNYGEKIDQDLIVIA